MLTLDEYRKGVDPRLWDIPHYWRPSGEIAPKLQGRGPYVLLPSLNDIDNGVVAWVEVDAAIGETLADIERWTLLGKRSA